MKVVGALISLVGVMLLGSVSFAATCPELVSAPTYQVGDRFVWRYTVAGERIWEVTGLDGTVAQVKWTDPGMRFGYDNAGTYFLDQDWVIIKGINKRGEAVSSPKAGAFAMLSKKVLDFPLQLGKTWEVNYLNFNMSGGSWGAGKNSGPVENYFLSMKVVGCEEVATPAGKFWALKMEGKLSDWTSSGVGAIYQWYSPKAKNIVRFQFGQCQPSTWCDPLRPQDFELTRLDLK